MNNRIFLNLFIVLFSIGVVFFFRMESRKTSYVIQKRYEVLKTKRKEHHIMVAQLRTDTGESTLYNRSEKMVALKAASGQQIVMVNKEIMVAN